VYLVTHDDGYREGGEVRYTDSGPVRRPSESVSPGGVSAQVNVSVQHGEEHTDRSCDLLMVCVICKLKLKNGIRGTCVFQKHKETQDVYYESIKREVKRFVYYESIKRELKRRLIYEYRCDERLKTKKEESILLSDTGLVVELEHLKTKTRLIDEKFASVTGECETSM
jgi:hypothetical protein